ncbi:sporulation and cell division protein SsgA [Haloactinopolyspora alba]|uniref:Sporulation and cell division protein SsgA n=1 Tax=Haloactinopolyspora alba TaxID=648780 RepID=A0A2P8DIA6_9ACTN|nr:SsgA family sporulation/cell division regulator [Haloactinopolyspora alba]PSK96956.1 sporulation and cell division protein SsgA [Haloactinopolyspora alba]
MHASTISYPLALRLLDGVDDDRYIQAELRYRTGDPVAVTAVFDTAGHEPVPWVFARDLLSGGLDEPTGDGDIRVWPGLDGHGTRTVRFRLRSPDGDALLEAPAHAVEDFLIQTWSLVPTGAEGRLLGIDALLDSLLNRT